VGWLFFYFEKFIAPIPRMGKM